MDKTLEELELDYKNSYVHLINVVIHTGDRDRALEEFKRSSDAYYGMKYPRGDPK